MSWILNLADGLKNSPSSATSTTKSTKTSTATTTTTRVATATPTSTSSATTTMVLPNNPSSTPATPQTPSPPIPSQQTPQISSQFDTPSGTMLDPRNVVTEQKQEQKQLQPPPRADGDAKEELKSGEEMIWASIERLKTSIKTIDAAVSQLTDRVAENKSYVDDKFVQLNHRITLLDNSIDSKIALANEELEKRLMSRIDSTKKSLEDKVNNVKKQLNDIPSSSPPNTYDLGEEKLLPVKNRLTLIESTTKGLPALNSSVQHIQNLCEAENKRHDDLIKDLYQKLNTHFDECNEIARKSSLPQMVQQNEFPSHHQTQTTRHEFRPPNFSSLPPLPHPPRPHTFPARHPHGGASPRNSVPVYRQPPPSPQLPQATPHAIKQGKAATDDTVRRTTPPPPPAGNDIMKKDPELIMCIDSNITHLIPRKLCTTRRTHIQQIGKLSELNTFIDNLENLRNLKYFFFSVGCNDIDYRNSDAVFDLMKQTVDNIRQKFPGVKIILSEITPRMDERDNEVIDTNTKLNEYVAQHDDLFLTTNSNMRDEDFFVDAKHFNQQCIPRFAKNIKIALGKAFGYKGNQKHTVDHRKHDSNPRQVSSDVKTAMNLFKANLLQSITEAFERANF